MKFNWIPVALLIFGACLARAEGTDLVTQLGNTKVSNKLSKCVTVEVQSWKMSEPMPTDYQLPVSALSPKGLSDCGCKKHSAEAKFLLKNKSSQVIKSSQWFVTGPNKTAAKYTLNVSITLANLMIPPLTLEVSCVGR